MLQYPTPSDLHHGDDDVGDATMPKGGWEPGHPDNSQLSVNADSDDLQTAQRQRVSKSLPTNCTPAAAAYMPRDPYPAQAQSHCSGPYVYHSQLYSSTVNDVQPPYDFSEYSIHVINAHHYEHYSQPPLAVSPILPSSSSSELGHALVETPPESQPIKHGSMIALPSLSISSPPVPKYEPSETLAGLNPIQTEYTSTVNGQPFHPSTSLSTFPLSDEIVPASLVPNPKAGQGVLKLPSAKRRRRCSPGLACLFCRERKIACGGPPEGSADLTCNQCARRSLNCEWPVMSRRGLHRCRDNGDSHPDYKPTNP